jgi:hypothetical protein
MKGQNSNSTITSWTTTAPIWSCLSAPRGKGISFCPRAR